MTCCTGISFSSGSARENLLSRATGIALVVALLIISLQWVCVKAAFLVVECTPQVQELAAQYFFVRIWAAPATLSLMAFKGWFIGMQDSVSSMAVDLVVNIVNIAASIVLTLGFRSGGLEYEGIGFAGVAAGTVVAQYSGLVCAVLIILFRYRRKVFAGYGLRDGLASMKGGEMRRFFSLNTNLFIRSVCFIGIYMGFTTLAARYGDLMLASATIMMKIMMLFSYFTDGFAYAGEALTGKFIGMQDKPSMIKAVRYTFIWSMAIGVVFMGIYAVSGVPMLRLMTADNDVVEAAGQFLPWLLLMPVVGCAAFAWDGVYIGATASKAIRDAMLWATAGFVGFYYAGVFLLDMSEFYGTSGYGPMGIHILLFAYFVHLVIRTVYLSVKYRKVVRTEPFLEHNL